MERSGIGMSTMMPGMSNAMPAANMNMMMIPRCTVRMEKCDGGMKMMCMSDDQMASGMMQNLADSLCGGMVSCSMLMNGMMVMNCNLTMGMCKCETAPKGIVMTCTSGDASCCKMIQACCDTMMAMMMAGCTCCLSMNNTPCCCGGC